MMTHAGAGRTLGDRQHLTRRAARAAAAAPPAVLPPGRTGRPPRLARRPLQCQPQRGCWRLRQTVGPRSKRRTMMLLLLPRS